MSGRRKLLTVEETLLISGRGLAIAPALSEDVARTMLSSFPVELVKPDGSVLEATFTVAQAFGTGADNPKPFGLLRNLNKEDVPVGTEVWYEIAECV